MAANKAVVVNASGAIVAPVSAATFRNNNGLQIGLNIQAWSADLDNFVTNGSWSGTTLVLAAGLNVGTTLNVGTVLTVNEIQMGASAILDLGANSTLTVSGTTDLTGTLTLSGVTNKPTARFDLELLESRLNFRNSAQAFYNKWFSGSPTQASLGFIGDSLAALAQESFWFLTAQSGLAGVCVGGGIGVVGGPTFTGTGATQSSDFARWWRGSYDQLAAADTAIYDYNTTGAALSNSLKVYYLKESGAGTFRIQTSLDGAAYSTEGSDVDTNNASASSGVVTIDKSGAPGMYRVKIVGISGTVRILGVRFAHTGIQGWVPFALCASGTDFDQWDDCPAAVLAPVFSDLAPKLFYFSNTGSTTEARLDTMRSRITTAIGSASYDMYICGVWPSQFDSHIAQNVILRDWAAENYLNYGSPCEAWPTWAVLDSEGYATDGTHPTRSAVAYWLSRIGAQFGTLLPPPVTAEGIRGSSLVINEGTWTNTLLSGGGFESLGEIRCGTLYSYGGNAGVYLNDRADGKTADGNTIYRSGNALNFRDLSAELMNLTNTSNSGVLALTGASAALTINSVPVVTTTATQTLTNKQVQADDGSVGTPAFTFDADPDNGLYRIGTNNVGFSIGGTKLIDFSSALFAVTGEVASLGSGAGVRIVSRNGSAGWTIFSPSVAALQIYDIATNGYSLEMGLSGGIYSWRPTTTETGDLGASSQVWRQLYLSRTITAGGTTGAQTINKASGSVNLAAAATSLVVTNSLVSASSIILANVATNDANNFHVRCVPASGSFTIHVVGTAPAAETKVQFLVMP